MPNTKTHNELEHDKKFQIMSDQTVVVQPIGTLVPYGRNARTHPNMRIGRGKDSEGEVGTTSSGFRLATSVGGTLTGRGGNPIVIDDPLKPADAHSKALRERANEWFRTTLLSRLDDLAGVLLEAGGWKVLSLPAIAETEETVPIGRGRSWHRSIGDLLQPDREPKAVLDELKRSIGSAAFAAQYQQTPVPAEGNLIRWAWFNRYETPPHRQSTDTILQSWDTASSAGELADYSVCTTWLVRGETFYLLDILRDRLAYPDLKRAALRQKEAWRPDAILIENKGSGTSLVQDLWSAGVHTIPVTPTADKVLRVSAETARIESRAVHLPVTAPWLDDFRDELLAFPEGRHDDQVDAMTQALGWHRLRPAVARSISF